MGIQNFPAALQDIIQQGFLEREFQSALSSRLGYRACADREEVAVGIGETLTKTRAGLKPAVTQPISPAANTNFENGLSPVNSFPTEQYTLAINHYAATTDLNMVTSRVGIASQFLLNAAINGEQAARSLDELARNALFGAYFGGNTRVKAALAAPSTTLAVDDIRGFTTTVFVNGVMSPIGVSALRWPSTIGGATYTLGRRDRRRDLQRLDRPERQLRHPHASPRPGQHRRWRARQRRPGHHRQRHHPSEQPHDVGQPRRSGDVLTMSSAAQRGRPASPERRPRDRRRLQLLPRSRQRPPALRRQRLPPALPGCHQRQPGVQARHGQRLPRPALHPDHRSGRSADRRTIALRDPPPDRLRQGRPDRGRLRRHGR